MRQGCDQRWADGEDPAARVRRPPLDTKLGSLETVVNNLPNIAGNAAGAKGWPPRGTCASWWGGSGEACTAVDFRQMIALRFAVMVLDVRRGGWAGVVSTRATCGHGRAARAGLAGPGSVPTYAGLGTAKGVVSCQGPDSPRDLWRETSVSTRRSGSLSASATRHRQRAEPDMRASVVAYSSPHAAGRHRVPGSGALVEGPLAEG